MAKRRAVRRLDHPWDLSAGKGRFAVALLVGCLFLALTAGLVAIYARVSSLQAVQDERIARQGVREGRREAVVTEGEDLLKGLRSLVRDLTATVHLERVTANERRDQLEAERAASEALGAQLNAQRFAAEALCAQLNAERVALEALGFELDPELVDLTDLLYRALGPARVDQAVARIKAARARAERERAQREKPAASSGDEETKREQPPRLHATPAGQRTAHAQEVYAQSEQPAAPAGEEPPEPARPTTLPTTPEDLDEQRKLVAATAAGDVDADDTAATHAWSSAALATALEAEAGGATLSPRRVPRALPAGAVAPPASAPPPLPSAPALTAAGLGWRPTSPHGARPPAPLPRTATITGMPALHPQAPTEGTLPERSSGATRKQGGADRSMHTPAGSAPGRAVFAFAKTEVSMQAHVAAPTSSPPASAMSFFEDETDEERESKRDTETNLPPRAPRPGNEDGEATEVIAIDPKALQHALRPTVQEGLRGLEDVPEAAPGRQRGHAEETPRKSRMTVLEAGK